MIILLSIFIVSAALTYIELALKTPLLRLICVVGVLYACIVLAVRVGTTIERANQLNRFARLFPEALAALDELKTQPDVLTDAIHQLKLDTSDTRSLDNFEAVVNDLQRRRRKEDLTSFPR